MTALLPGDKARVWIDSIDVDGPSLDQAKLAMRVPNPLKNGNPIRFANKTQDVDAVGWLTLGPLDRK